MTELDPKALWQSQTTISHAIDLPEIKRRARWSVRIINLRNAADHLGNITVVVFLIVFFFTLNQGPAYQVACVVSIPGMVVSSWLIWKNASVLRPPTEASAKDFLQFQRAQLTRQLQAVRKSWIWYLGPLIVAVPVFAVAHFLDSPAKGRWALVFYFTMTAGAVAATLGINAVRTARLKRMLAHFDQLAVEG